MRTTLCGAALAVLLIGGCPLIPGGSSEKQITLRVYGEEFIEDQIPSDETDGWTITFDRFLICIGSVEIERSGGVSIASSDAYRVFDLAASSAGDGFELETLAAVSADGVHRVRYRVAPATDATLGNATEADLALLRDNGYSVYAEVSATDGSETRTFALGFTSTTTYGGCFTTIDFDDDGNAAVELTIHGDHLFYADLSDHPPVRFGAIAAADADSDGQVTRDELEAADLATLIDTLIQTLGHIDGEGHCADVSSD